MAGGRDAGDEVRNPGAGTQGAVRPIACADDEPGCGGVAQRPSGALDAFVHGLVQRQRAEQKAVSVRSAGADRK